LKDGFGCDRNPCALAHGARSTSRGIKTRMPAAIQVRK